VKAIGKSSKRKKAEMVEGLVKITEMVDNLILANRIQVALLSQLEEDLNKYRKSLPVDIERFIE
jgi:hypothetical protein